nr:MAG: replication associated protein [Cressdnaviricota sp.]
MNTFPNQVCRKGQKARAFVFTWNNYTPEVITHIRDKIPYEWVIYSEEIAPTTGTPHLQGYIRCKGAQLWSSYIKFFTISEGNSAHIAPAKGDPETNWTYITKPNPDESPKTVYEYGTRPEFTRKRITALKNLGKANEANEAMWAQALKDARNGDFDCIPPNLYVRYRRTWYDEYRMHKKPQPMEGFIPRPWQQKVLDLLEEKPDDRTILWYWDMKGNVGKSTLTKYLQRNLGAYISMGGKNADIAYCYNNEPIAVFDLTRATTEEFMPFKAMESLKNGWIFSPKYESCNKYFDPPHVVVFANVPCPKGKFSEDRIKETQLGLTHLDVQPTELPNVFECEYVDDSLLF